MTITGGRVRLGAVLPRFIAVGVLVALGVAKCVTPYRASYAVPEWGCYTSACFELLIAVGLVVRPGVAWALLLFSLVSIVFSLLQSGDCG